MEYPKSAHNLVIDDILRRKEVGIKTYGKELNVNSPEDMLEYAYEEALDLACYLRNEMEKRQIKKEATTKDRQKSKDGNGNNDTNNKLARGQVGEITPENPSVVDWVTNLMNEIMPAFLEGYNLNVPFQLNDVKSFIANNQDLFPFIDKHKRISSAFDIMRRQNYFFKVSRYEWGVGAKYIDHLQKLNRCPRMFQKTEPKQFKLHLQSSETSA